MRLKSLSFAIALAFAAVVVFLDRTSLTADALPAPFTQVVIQPGQGSWGNGLADLNGDSYPDIAAAGGDLGGNVYWYEYPTWTRHQIGSTGGGDDLQIADINNDGYPDVVVNGLPIIWYENPLGKGGDVRDMWTDHVVDGDLASHDIALADLNVDGRLDIVIRVELGDTYFYLQGSTPDTWTRVLVSTAPPGHGALAVGDIDRDGRPDIVENGFWLQQPSNLTNGSFWRQRTFADWTDGASIALHDLNQDGRLDVILAVSESGVGNMSWFEAPPDPIRDPWIAHDIDVVEDVHRFHVVDMNKDGNPDIAFAEMQQSATQRVGVYYNSGLGESWTLQVLSTEGSHNIVVGDVGNDDDIDIIGANWDSGSAQDGGAMNLWRNDINKARTFDQWSYIQIDGARTPPPTFGLTFGDLDRDGRTDVVAGRYWYRNPGGNLTGTWTRTDFGEGVDAMLVTDVDGDGQLDVIAEREDWPNIDVLWLKPNNSSFRSWTSTRVGTLPDASRDIISQGYRIAPLNLDGTRAIVLSSDVGPYYFTIPATNPGAGNWPRVQVDTDGTQEGVDVGDINRDGRLDIVGFSHTSETLQGTEVDWWERQDDGSGNWTRHVVGTTTNEADRIRIADINLDGRPDIVATDTTNYGPGELYWFENTADGTWVSHSVSGQIGALNSMDVGDIDNDGEIDIVVGEHANDGRTLVFENVNNGASWNMHVVDSNKETHLGAQLADLDGDGDLDIVSTAYNDYPFLHLWRNDALPLETGSSTPPTVAAAATANPAPVTGTTTSLTVLGADDGGEAALTYTWATTGTVPAPVVFSANGTNAAKNVVVTFAKAGTYSFEATVQDSDGLTVTSSVAVTVNQTATTVDVTPSSISIVAGGTRSFTATTADQFGQALSPQPGFTWTVSGGGTIDPADGIFTAGAVPGGPFTVMATTGGPSGIARVTVVAQLQAVGYVQGASITNDNRSTSVAQAFPSSNTQGNLIVAAISWGGNESVACTDTAGNAYEVATTQFDNANNQSLAICYAANVKPGANSVRATFTGSTPYRRLLIHEYKGIATANPLDVVAMNLADGTTTTNGITSTVATTTADGDLIVGAVMDDGGVTSITAGTGFTKRQSLNNADLVSQDSVLATAGPIASTWTFGSRHRYLAQMVAFKAGESGLPNAPPTVATPAAATPESVTGTTASLSVLGADDGGEANLSYTWATTGTPPAAVTFSLNGSNAAKTTVATFAEAGSYSFQVTIEDADRLIATSTVAVTVSQTLTNVAVTPSSISVSTGETQAFTASGFDQFGTALVPQPTFSWSVSGGGTISTSGLFTAGSAAGGPFTVTATGEGKTGTADVSVVASDGGVDPGDGAASGGGVAYLQGAATTDDASATDLAMAFSTANTAGNLIVVAVSWGNSATVSCADSQGNTYAVATTQHDGTNNQSLAICYAINVKAGANTVTATFSSAAQYRRVLIHEYQGVALTSPVDVIAMNVAEGTTTGDAITSTAAVTSTPGDLIFAAVMDDSGTNDITEGTGFNLRQSVNGTDLMSEDQIQTSAGSVEATQTFSAAHRYLAQMVAFKRQ